MDSFGTLVTFSFKMTWIDAEKCGLSTDGRIFKSVSHCSLKHGWQGRTVQKSEDTPLPIEDWTWTQWKILRQKEREKLGRLDCVLTSIDHQKSNFPSIVLLLEVGQTSEREVDRKKDQRISFILLGFCRMNNSAYSTWENSPKYRSSDGRDAKRTDLAKYSWSCKTRSLLFSPNINKLQNRSQFSLVSWCFQISPNSSRKPDKVTPCPFLSISEESPRIVLNPETDSSRTFLSTSRQLKNEYFAELCHPKCPRVFSPQIPRRIKMILWSFFLSTPLSGVWPTSKTKTMLAKFDFWWSIDVTTQSSRPSFSRSFGRSIFHWV